MGCARERREQGKWQYSTRRSELTSQLWLSGGHLHLIPLSVRSSSSSLPKQLADDQYDDGSGRAFDPDAWVSEADALAAVRTGKYRADAGVENAVWERISWCVIKLRLLRGMP